MSPPKMDTSTKTESLTNLKQSIKKKKKSNTLIFLFKYFHDPLFQTPHVGFG